MIKYLHAKYKQEEFCDTFPPKKSIFGVGTQK